MHRARAIAAICFLMSTALIGAFRTAGADTFGAGSGIYLADSSVHSYCFYTNLSTTTDRQPFHDAMAYLDDRTVMSDSFSSTCDSSTDVMFLRNDGLVEPGTSNPVRGLYLCVNEISSTVCGGSWIATNWWEILSNGGDFNLNLAKTARHELGHSNGLRHYTDDGDRFNPMGAPSCTGCDAQDSMIRGPIGGGTGWEFLVWISFNDHHKGHIDGAY